MKQVTEILASLSSTLAAKGASKAVVGEMISAGDYHVVPLCEVAIGLGSGGGQGTSDGDANGVGKGEGTGIGAGGSAKVQPVAVIVVDNGGVRIERLG